MAPAAHRYAQSIIQLFNQLRFDGWSKENMVRVADAYELAKHLLTGSFRPSGKPFLEHLVGTASILASLGAPPGVVVAGLLHAAYDNGDFGTIGGGISDGKREEVRRAVGAEVEERIARYSSLRLSSQAIPILRDRLDGLDAMDRDVLLMRLSDTLEDHLDLGILYCSNAEVRQRFTERHGPTLVDMAGRLGYPALAEELQVAFEAVRSRPIPTELHAKSNQNRAYLIAPRSYRTAWLLLPGKAAHRLTSLIGKVRRRMKKSSRHG